MGNETLQPKTHQVEASDSRFVVLNENPPERCEICHQTDLFDPQTGECRRCSGLPLPELLQDTNTDFEPDQPEVLTPQTLQNAVVEHSDSFDWEEVGDGQPIEPEEDDETVAHRQNEGGLGDLFLMLMGLTLVVVLVVIGAAVLGYFLYFFIPIFLVFVALPKWLAKKAGESE